MLANNRVPKKNLQQQEKLKQEEYVTNKILAVFSICLFGVLGLMYLNQVLYYSPNYEFGLKILSAVQYIGIALGIVAIVMMVREQKNGAPTQKLLSGRNLMLVAVLLVLMCMLIHRYNDSAIKAFYGILPALAIYYLVYHSYQPEFFVAAADCGVAAMFLLVIRALHGGMLGWAAAVPAVVLCGLQIYYTKKRLAGDKLPAGFGPHAAMVLNVTAVAMAALVVLGAALGTTATFYLLCVAAAYVFVLAVYYTVKLM